MNRISPTDRAMVEELVERAGTHTPDYADEVLAATAGVRQRPAWTFGSWWLPDAVASLPALRFGLVAALLGAALLGLLAVAGSKPDEPEPSPTPDASPVAAGTYAACAAAASAPVTLTAWDHEAGGGVRAVIDELIAGFEAANPGVTIVRERKTDGGLAAGLADAGGPDILQVAAGRESMGEAVAGGLLVPLSDYEREYGWSQRWAPGLLARSRFGDDEREYGSGTLYGVSLTSEIVGLFANFQMMNERPAGVNVTTLDEHVDDFAVIREQGYLPVMFGAADGQAILIYGSILEAMVEPGWSDDLVFGRAGATFDTPETRAAAEMLVAISDRGFLTEGYGSIGYDESVARFIAGEGQFLWTTSGVASTLSAVDDAYESRWYFSALVARSPDGYARAIGGLGMPWSIRRSSPNAECAAAFLDYLTTDRAMTVIAGHGVLPARYEGGSRSQGVFMDLTRSPR